MKTLHSPATVMYIAVIYHSMHVLWTSVLSGVLYSIVVLGME